MGNLPFTLPACDRPATVRLEVFSNTSEGLPGSLDASVYTCEQHADPATDAIEGTNRTAHRLRMAPDVQRTCGHVYLFPTGQLAGHPAWCDLDDCGRRLEHRSAVAHVETGRPEPVIVDVALVQAVSEGAEPALSLTVVDGRRTPVPASERVLLSTGQATALVYRVRQLVDAARGGRR